MLAKLPRILLLTCTAHYYGSSEGFIMLALAAPAVDIRRHFLACSINLDMTVPSIMIF